MLAVQDVKVCGGPEVKDGSVVSLLYRVATSEQDLLEGRCLETNYSPDVPITVVVADDQLLRGVYETLLGMRAGGSVRRAYVPSKLAFGDRSAGDLPASTDLWLELCVSRVSDPELP